MRRSCRSALSSLALSLFWLLSCSRPVVHVHDRHGLSHAPIEAWARRHPGGTLLLLDYHHDVGPRMPRLSSVDWVGDLLESGKIARLVWVSGRDLELPNRASRMDWLNRSLADRSPAEAQAILARITLADWSDLDALDWRGALAVSLDLDILTKDPGDPPERFLREMARWISRRSPEILTIALSSAYQPHPERAWGWLAEVTEALDLPSVSWKLECGSFSPEPESREEAAAWRSWAESDSSFQPCASLWISCPPRVSECLLARGIRAGDGAASDVISSWADPGLRALKEEFPDERISELARLAANAITRALEENPERRRWEDCVASAPPATSRERGVAVRLRNDGLDRGCLALWKGVADMEGAVEACARAALVDPRYPAVTASEEAELSVEFSLFGPWIPMDHPLDFRLGTDSLILVRDGDPTLLQASLAVQRGLDREGFLAILSRKAGMGEGGWREDGLEFRRSATLSREYQPSQKKAKK